MTCDEIAKGLRICKAATPPPWGGEGFRVDIPTPEGDYCFRTQEFDAAFIRYARTALPDALKESAVWAREFAVLQEAYLKLDAAYSGQRKEHLALLMAGAEWVSLGSDDWWPCGRCGKDDCAACRMAILSSLFLHERFQRLVRLGLNSAPVAPPFAEEAKEMAP